MSKSIDIPSVAHLPLYNRDFELKSLLNTWQKNNQLIQTGEGLLGGNTAFTVLVASLQWGSGKTHFGYKALSAIQERQIKADNQSSDFTELIKRAKSLYIDVGEIAKPISEENIVKHILTQTLTLDPTGAFIDQFTCIPRISGNHFINYKLILFPRPWGSPL